MENFKKQNTASSRTFKKQRVFDFGSEFFLQDEFLRARLRSISKFTGFPNSILISGPSGCGKTSLAFELWRMAKQPARPFVIAHCHQIKHSKDLKRLFQKANYGDLFLRHIEELSPDLLSVLDSFLANFSHVRVIGSALEGSKMPQSLFSVLINIPSLKKRKNEIHHYISCVMNQKGTQVNCTALAVNQLLNQEWKGEFLELAECLRKSLWFAKKENRHYVTEGDVLRSLSFKHIDFWQFEVFKNRYVRESLSRKGLKSFLKDIEAMAIALGLSENLGNFSKLARSFQMPMNTLVSRHKILRKEVEELSEIIE